MFAVSSERRLDLAYGGLLVALTAVMLLPGSLTLPMELWDESRNANNALEMADGGSWLVTTFGGVPDHWNTKPPLLIWIVAALLRAGMEPMLALRLPSILATMGSVLLVYVACRTLVRDQLAGLLGGLLLICSVLFMGDHSGRTGDFDALLALLHLGFVLCLGRYIDLVPDRSGVWIAAAAVLLFLAAMTKGVASGLAMPGLLAYAIARGRFLAMMRDWRLWASVFGVLAALAGWLALRERFDPGYLAALWGNDIGGRMLNVLDAHDEGPFFYLVFLTLTFQPAVLLLPTLLAARRDPDPARRHVCLLMILTAASWLLALSCARTKLYWYVAPALPLLAIAIGVATTTYLRKGQPPLPGRVVLRPIAVALLIAFWYLNIRAHDAGSPYTADQVWYGPFLNEIRGEARLDGAFIVDHGLPNDAGFQNYNPIAAFYAREAQTRGEHIRVVAPGAQIPVEATLISCDPLVRDWLKSQSFFTAIRANTHCVMGRVAVQPDPQPG